MNTDQLLPERRIYYAGYPSPIGGAGTECIHTIKMWQRHGIEVHLIPTWGPPEANRQKAADELGCITHVVSNQNELHTIAGLEGSVVVSMCNIHFAGALGRFRALGCKTVWLNCMTYIQGPERRGWKEHGVPDRWIYQSQFQRNLLEDMAAQHGLTHDQGHLIRGAFEWQDWEFQPRPREAGDKFLVGKAARPDPMKWYSGLWDLWRQIPNVKGICLGMDERNKMNLGRPKGLEVSIHAPEAISSEMFFKQLHAMVTMNDAAKENWPRVGLEAMAQGVPIVTERKWGWLEMIDDGRTGLLADNANGIAEQAKRLEADEEFRLQIATNAREALETELANPDTIWQGWCDVFRALGADYLCESPFLSEPAPQTDTRDPGEPDETTEKAPAEGTEPPPAPLSAHAQWRRPCCGD